MPVGPGVTIPLGAEPRPCGGCREGTKVRVHDEPWHYGCYARAHAEPAGPAPAQRRTIDEIANITKALRERCDTEVDDDAAGLVLAAWHQATGGLMFSSGWVGDIGTTAYAWLRAKHGADRRGILGASRISSPAATKASLDLVLHLDHVSTDVRPKVGKELVELDVNGQFLASASIALGNGEPTVVDRPRSIAGYLQLPGYVRLAEPLAVTAEQLPHTWRMFRGVQEGRTLALTTARYLTKRGVELAVSEAVIWPEHRRHLNGWYELFRDARSYLMRQEGPAAELALKLVKQVANTTLGGWLRSEKNSTDLMRRDWSDMVICEAWHRELLHIERLAEAGARPLGVRRDALWYQVDPGAVPAGYDPDDPDTRDRKLGKLKLQRRVPITPAIVKAHKGGSTEILVREIIRELDAA